MTQITIGAITGTQLTGLPAGGRLSVTIAAMTAAGVSAESAAVAATLPRAATTVETAAYDNAATYSFAPDIPADMFMAAGAGFERL